MDAIIAAIIILLPAFLPDNVPPGRTYPTGYTAPAPTVAGAADQGSSGQSQKSGVQTAPPAARAPSKS